MLVVDDLEEEREEGTEDFHTIFEVEAHVERLDVGKVFEEVKIALERGVLGVLETAELFDEEEEDRLDRSLVLVRGLRGEDSQDVGDAACHQKLDISGGMV